jgi:hypothetical protein
MITLREYLWSPRFWWGTCCSFFFKDLCVGFFSFIYFCCPRHVSCVPNVASFSGLCPFLTVSSIFSNIYLFTHYMNNEIVDVFLNIYLVRTKESFPAMENQKLKGLSWKHVILILLFARVAMPSIQYLRQTMTSLFDADQIDKTPNTKE